MLLGTLLILGLFSLSVLESCMTLLMPVFKYGGATMIWKEKERPRIRAVQRFA